MLRQLVLTAERTVTRAGDVKEVLTAELRLENGPVDASRIFHRLWACSQVLTCVRPQNAASARRGPLWKSADRGHYAYARSKTLGGVLVCPIPSSDRLSIILR